MNFCVINCQKLNCISNIKRPQSQEGDSLAKGLVFLTVLTTMAKVAFLCLRLLRFLLVKILSLNLRKMSEPPSKISEKRVMLV